MPLLLPSSPFDAHRPWRPFALCSFRLGRQEDAHEFLIALLDAMHEASIAGMSPKPPPELAQTSFIYRIFGGRMRSQVRAAALPLRLLRAERQRRVWQQRSGSARQHQQALCAPPPRS